MRPVAILLLAFASSTCSAGACTLPESELVVAHRTPVQAVHQPIGKIAQELREADGGVIVLDVELNPRGSVASVAIRCTTVPASVADRFLRSVRNWEFELPSNGSLRGETVVRIEPSAE
jgi:hypothetical protein